MHVSNPIGEMKVTDGERFPNTLGENSKRYWKQSLEAYKDKSRIIINDVKDTVHLLRRDDILYISAYRRYCLVHTVSGDSIRVHVPIKEFLANVDEHFMSIHRCYIINISYLKSIQPHEVILIDGTKLPVPVKRYTEIKKSILTYHREEGSVIINKDTE